MNNFTRSYYPLIVLLFGFSFFIYFLYTGSVNAHDGVFTYALDDPYIHMTIADNLADNGSFGIAPGTYTAASSSPLWTLMIAGSFALFGKSLMMPFALNLFFAFIALILAYKELKNHIGRNMLFVVTGLLFFSAPFSAIIFTGLEHTAHIVFTMLFVLYAARELSDEKSKSFPIFILITLILTSLRFEGAFLVFFVSIIMFFRSGFKRAAVIAAAGMLPIIIGGLVSVSNGWYFFPTSILLKGTLPHGFNIGEIIKILVFTIMKQVTKSPHLLVLLLSAAGMLVYRIRKGSIFSSISSIYLLLFILGTLMHLQLAGIGWFYRYEAYLTFLGLFAAAASAADIMKENSIRFADLSIKIKLSVMFAMLIFAMPLLHRGADAAKNNTQATTNIYEQQYQSAKFIDKYYSGESIILNDIGLVNYYADIKTLDFWGLADMDIAGIKRAQNFNREHLNPIIEKSGSKIAVIYEAWYDYVIPFTDQWFTVGYMTIKNNVVCGEDKVHFYALGTEEADRLRANLREFAKTLPDAVEYQEIK